MIDVKNNGALENLSDKEKEIALRILSEYSDKGFSKEYSKLKYDDYEQIPISIEEFLRDKQYLGSSLIDSEGKFTVYPYWVETLKKIFPDNITTNYHTFVLTGSIGIGKSFIGVVCALYMLYRMICLKDPYLHYGLQPIDKITFAFLNITLDAAESVAWQKCQELLQNSPWFVSHGTISGNTNIVWNPPKGIDLVTGSQPRHIIGRAIFFAMLDEVSFQINQDVAIQKKKAKELVSSADARMQSRFMQGESNPTLLVLASSKRTEQSYLETFIQNKEKNESKTTLVVDEPQWVIRTDKNTEKKFKVAVGNKFLDSEVIPLETTEKELALYLARGYTLLDVPMGYYENFVDDIDIALTDIAGISTSSVTRYLSGSRITQCKKETLQNLFTKDIIQVGNAPDDEIQYSDFCDLQRIDPKLKSRPLYIHLDMSLSGDNSGISGVWIKGKVPHIEGKIESKELYYTLAFSVGIKAPKGHQVSFEKNRQFIYWLRENGFVIRGVSYDTYQSADLGQALQAKGFNTSVISVDRVDSQSKTCLPYLTLKNAIYENRFEMYDSRQLTEEFVGLERDNNGKIDHSASGINQKDIADSVCGALYNASQHAAEFAFEYGETLDSIVEVSNNDNVDMRKQAVVDFEEELKRISAPKVRTKSNEGFLDFGFGAATTNFNPTYLMSGIIL